MTQYRLVYDAATVGLNYEIVLFVVAGPLFAAVMYYLQRNDPRRKAWPKGFLIFWSVAWVSLGGLGAYNVNLQRLRCAEWARDGQYEIVEGVVAQFHPMPAAGHDTERFTVAGVPFEYSDYDLSQGGFNNAASHGGPIHSGLRVRIAYNQGRILKLWVAE